MNQGEIWDQDLAITIQMSHLREVKVLNTPSKAKVLQMPNKLVDKMDIFLDQVLMILYRLLEKKGNNSQSDLQQLKLKEFRMLVLDLTTLTKTS
jgi:hypothetical protein